MNIKRGVRVRIPKGTPIRSMHPGHDKNSLSKRSRVVVIHHTLPAYRALLAFQYADGRLSFQGSYRDRITLCADLGLPYQTEAEAQASLESLVSKATIEPYAPESRVNVLWIEREPTRICWAGTGGYWCEAPISAAQPL